MVLKYISYCCLYYLWDSCIFLSCLLKYTGEKKRIKYYAAFESLEISAPLFSSMHFKDMVLLETSWISWISSTFDIHFPNVYSCFSFCQTLIFEEQNICIKRCLISHYHKLLNVLIGRWEEDEITFKCWWTGWTIIGTNSWGSCRC